MRNSPFFLASFIAVILILLVLWLAGVINRPISLWTQLAPDAQVLDAQVLTDRFWSTPRPDERLTSLAGLFNLPDNEDQARRFFYNELSPAEQLALFNLTDPQAVEEHLYTVIKGVYTAPNLVNNQSNNALLDAMVRPLRQLDYSPSLGTSALKIEMTQWLKGREFFHLPDQNQQAIHAYNIAIGMNDRNPGIYFDRGLAYAALGELSLALADLATVLSLDPSWQARVQQTLLNDPQLYLALWSEQQEYSTLVALAPTPTTDALILRFWSTPRPDERLTSLAGLFNLPDNEDQARRFFYNELSPAEQLALFNLTDPQAVEEHLYTVIKGVYTAPNLVNNQSNNALLDAMVRPLRQLDYSPSLGTSALKTEMTQWLRGREFFHLPDQNQQAIHAYDIAIGMNDRNPSIYFDRGLAYAALGELSLALADLATVLSLDPSWQARVQQTLLNDPQLYLALWSEQQEYSTLVALLPTPTSIPGSTATPTSTPHPTLTDTPALPTFTPTTAATTTPVPSTPTATAVSSSPPAGLTATPTPTSGQSIPAGTFTLLNPLDLEKPSYGQTDFEWEWIGSVTPGFGFEVRIWQEGEPPAGAHDAVLDNQNRRIVSLGENKYRLSLDIKGAAGVQGRSGEYWWTVALVQINPHYADVGQQADPARLRFEAGGGGSSEGGGESSGGGVGIK